MTYRDSRQGTLQDYPRPSVAVDTAVLTVADRELCVVLAEKDGHRRLPGSFLHEGERLIDAVQRSLREKVGIEGLQPEQLQVFDDPDRDDRGWVLAVAHVDVVPLERLGPAVRHVLEPVRSARGLQYDHDAILGLAVARLRSRYEARPDPARLLGETFTLRDLQLIHEAVRGEPFGSQRDGFRKRMEKRLEDTGEQLRGTVGKPPRLFRRRESHRR